MNTEKIILSTLLSLSLVLTNISLIGFLIVGTSNVMMTVFLILFLCFLSVSIGSYKELKKEIYRGNSK
jgi:hypothetical protein